MATDVAMGFQGLECPLCLNLLEEPKLLSCTHSFCEKCLQELHHSQGMPQDLKCPFCRQITRLGTKGLCDLKTFNVPLKSMVGDLKTRRKLCTVCDPKAKPPAIHVHHCQQCDEYMCGAVCLQAHEIFHKKSSHESKPKQVTSRAEAVTFTPYRLDDEHNLRRLNINDWKLEKVADFPTSGKYSETMAQTKDGKMLVGYRDGGIQEFTVSGPQKTVFKNVRVSRISVLSDGHYVVRDMKENISLYSSAWDKLGLKEFKMKSSGDWGGMDVDKCDNIYVGYYRNKTINVFTPEGGAPIREIPCRAYTPWLLCTVNHSNMLVVNDGYSFRVIDQQGAVKHDVTKEGYRERHAVLSDDSILIGWQKDDLVSIDLYTNQLKHVRTVISGLDCKNWCDYALREFSSGEIAFYSDSKLYVLCKT